MYILENFWKLTLIILAAASAYIAWLRYDADHKHKILAQNLAEHFDPTIHTARSNPQRFEEAYLQAIATAKHVGDTKSKKKQPLAKLLKDATAANGLAPSYANEATRNISNALKTCKKFGIFSDGGANLELMEIGKPPIIQKGPYEGELLVPTLLLNPLIEKEALNQLLNTALVPEPIRTLNAYAHTSKSVQVSNAMEKADLITEDRADRAKRLYSTYRDKKIAEIKANL